MNARTYALLVALALAVGAIAAVVAFAPGGVFAERAARDYADKADEYCTEAVAYMRTVPGFEDIAATSFPAVTGRGERPTFACPARSWRGAFVVRVRARCAIPAQCTVVDALEDRNGRIVFTAGS